MDSEGEGIMVANGAEGGFGALEVCAHERQPAWLDGAGLCFSCVFLKVWCANDGVDAVGRRLGRNRNDENEWILLFRRLLVWPGRIVGYPASASLGSETRLPLPSTLPQDPSARLVAKSSSTPSVGAPPMPRQFP